MDTAKKICVTTTCVETFYAALCGMNGLIIPCIVAAFFAVVFAVLAVKVKDI